MTKLKILNAVAVFSVQKDDMDGEIDLKSCMKVSEFDVEKNYGFQIQASVSATAHPLSNSVYAADYHLCIHPLAALATPALSAQLFCYHDSHLCQHLFSLSFSSVFSCRFPLIRSRPEPVFSLLFCRRERPPSHCLP